MTETCTIDLFYPPTGATSGVSPGIPLYILEPGGSIISDSLDATFNGNLGGIGVAGYVITFLSDIDETLGLGPYVSGDSVIEDGTVQNGFTLTFDNNAGGIAGTATIQFQSDLDSPVGVPEPISLTLFGTGLIGLGALRRRNKATA